MNNDRIYYSHGAEVQAKRRMTIVMLVCLGSGFGIGMALALLFAPNTGEDTRQNLSENLGEGLQSGRESLDSFIKRLEGQFNDLHKNVEERLKQN